jgi:hypothetical protein
MKILKIFTVLLLVFSLSLFAGCNNMETPTDKTTPTTTVSSDEETTSTTQKKIDAIKLDMQLIDTHNKQLRIASSKLS